MCHSSAACSATCVMAVQCDVCILEGFATASALGFGGQGGGELFGILHIGKQRHFPVIPLLPVENIDVDGLICK